jgi:hypothetical protein
MACQSRDVLPSALLLSCALLGLLRLAAFLIGAQRLLLDLPWP